MQTIIMQYFEVAFFAEKGLEPFLCRVAQSSLCPGAPRYSKEPKSVIAFNIFTFFRAALIQSEVDWMLSPASDWIITARKNVKEGHSFELLAVSG